MNDQEAMLPHARDDDLDQTMTLQCSGMLAVRLLLPTNTIGKEVLAKRDITTVFALACDQLRV